MSLWHPFLLEQTFMMIQALIRFLFFEYPAAFFKGLAWILFDRQEIIATSHITRRFRNKNFKERVLRDYLEKCRKQVAKGNDLNGCKEEEKKENGLDQN